jgi:uncharacterized membrane protein HdeD (DUF308 family)
MDRLPEPVPQSSQYEQEWLEPQVETLDVSRMMASAITTFAVVTGVFGAIMLFWPGATVRVVAVLFGLWLLLSGVVMLVQALAAKGNLLLRALLAVGGVLSLIIGGICIVNGDASVKILVLFVVIGWIISGVTNLVVGIRNRYSPARGAYLFFGILQLVLAAFVIAWPNATVTVLVRVIGVGLLLTAAFALWAASKVRKGGQQANIVVINQQL